MLVSAIVFYVGIFLLLNIVKIKGKPLMHSLNPDLIWEGGNSYDRYREYSDTENYDVLVMGSSHAYRTFDPRIFEQKGLKMFNLGSSSQALDDTEILLKKMVKHKNAKTIVLEISPGSFYDDTYESTAFLVTNVPEDDIAFEMAKKRWDIKGLNLYIERLMRKMESKPIYQDDDYVGAGFCEKYDSLTTLPKYAEFENFKLKDESVNALKGILKYANENNINLVLTSQPMPKQTYRPMYEPFYELIDDLKEEYKLTYIDFSFNHDLDSKDHFYDHSHLNQAGVEVFNAAFLKEFNKLIKE